MEVIFSGDLPVGEGGVGAWGLSKRWVGPLAKSMHGLYGPCESLHLPAFLGNKSARWPVREGAEGTRFSS